MERVAQWVQALHWNWKVAVSNPTGRSPHLRDSAFGSKMKLNVVIKIGLVSLPPQKWPKIDRGEPSNS